MVCATMERAAGFGVQFFEWLKPSRSSPPSPSSFSSSATSSSSLSTIDRSAGGDCGLDTSLCLPLLGRLEERATSPDHGRSDSSHVKEEPAVSNLIAPGAREVEADVELNIGLPAIGDYSSEDAPMDEEDEEDDSEEEMEEDKCKAMMEEAGDEQVRIEMVEGSSSLRVGGEENMIKGVISSRGRRFWIPTPAQILVGPVQFICHVCSKTFNRYNNMQVIDDPHIHTSRFLKHHRLIRCVNSLLFGLLRRCIFPGLVSVFKTRPSLFVNSCGCFQVRVLLDFIYLTVQWIHT